LGLSPEKDEYLKEVIEIAIVFLIRNLTNSKKVRNSVMPVKAGIQNYLKTNVRV